MHGRVGRVAYFNPGQKVNLSNPSDPSAILKLKRDTTDRERERERETSHDKSFVAQRHFQLCALHLIEERRRRAETGGRKPRRPNITSAQHFPYLPAKICASSFKGLTDYNRETVRKMEEDKVWFLTFSPGPILNFEFLPESTRVKNSWCS